MDIIYRRMRESEASEVAALVSTVFSLDVSPNYSDEGIEEFFRYANTAGIIRRMKGNHFVYVAEHDSRIVGMIEVRDLEHISLLFVDSPFQRKGIGKELVKQAVNQCKAVNSTFKHISVNSSPNAVGAYRAIGFFETDSEQMKDGIRFTPMELNLANFDGA